MKPEQVLSLLEVPFTFSRRPAAIPGDMRPLWRIALITLFLHISSRGAKSSLTRLHALNWLSKTQASRDQLIRLLAREPLDGALIVRYEPSFNRALDLATGERLLGRLDGNKFSLTPKGARFAKEVEADGESMVPEKAFLGRIGKHFTETISSAITDGGSSV